MPDRADVNDAKGEQPVPSETSFSDAVSEFDASEELLLMAYSRYLDKPSPRRMNEIYQASSHTFDRFDGVLTVVMHDATGIIDEDSRPEIFATLVCDMTRNHTRLLADYTDDAEVSSEEDNKIGIESLASFFEELDDEALVEAVLDHFREARDTDMETIQRYMYHRASTPLEQLKSKAANGSIEVAKIGSGVLAALVIFDKVFK